MRLFVAISGRMRCKCSLSKTLQTAGRRQIEGEKGKEGTEGKGRRRRRKRRL
jgi:hypothetical protein